MIGTLIDAVKVPIRPKVQGVMGHPRGAVTQTDDFKVIVVISVGFHVLAQPVERIVVSATESIGLTRVLWRISLRRLARAAHADDREAGAIADYAWGPFHIRRSM